MKKLSAIIMSIALLLSIIPAFAAVSGEFTGKATGFGDEVSVTLTIKDDKIVSVSAEGASETQGIGSNAVEILPEKISETGSIGVETVSGATITSEALLEAAGNALSSAGLNPDDYMQKSSDEAKKEPVVLDCDIVVVGAGGAGMTAAISAADQGKKVILIESQSMVGGNTVRATGGMNAGKTPVQDTNDFNETAGVEKTLGKAKDFPDNARIHELTQIVQKQFDEYKANPEGYFDSAELMQLDTLIGGKGINNPELVKTFAESSASAVEWLNENSIALTNVSSLGGASVKRTHRPVGEDGKTISIGSYLVPRLEENVRERNIELILNLEAVSLIENDGRITGVKAKGDLGDDVTINAGAVILSTGGFGANLDMVEQLKPELKGFMTTNASGAQGAGIKMAQEAGAAVVDMKEIQIHPTVQFDTSALITEGLRGDGAILVNAEGRRFTDEVATRDVVSAAEIAQPGSFSYLIVDKNMADASSVIAGYIKKGFTTEGESVADLSDKLGMDAAVLQSTLDAWNECVKSGEDKEFGRTSFTNPLDTAPYYAIKVTAGIHHTMGGLKIDENTHVLNESGQAIPGLFAAGEVTGGIHGANRLGGNAVADIVVFGRIAGMQAAESLDK